MENPKSKKRQLEPDDHDTDNDNDNEHWPRFLLISASSTDVPLKLSPFAIEKGIQGIAGSPKSIRRLRSGDLLVEVIKKAHSNNLLKASTFVGIPIKCEPHKGLNSSKGVFRCSDLQDCSEDEILYELKDQGVTELKRIKIRRDGGLRDTNTFIVSFGFPKLPAFLKIGYLRTKVDVFIPNPQRCFKCQKYGHSRFTCRGKAICPKCGLDDHGDDACTQPEKCLNCNGGHPAFAKSCPIWIKEKEVQTLKTTRGIGFPEARRIVEAKYTVPSYANILEKKKLLLVHRLHKLIFLLIRM